jgi:hypothetical protein
MLNRLLLLIVLLVASGCDHWMEKLAPATTGFARHCFDLLQKHDFAALEALASPGLRTDDLRDRLAELAAQIPDGTPISSDAATFNVSTNNGYTTATVGMVYQFPSGWLEFDIAAEGRGDDLELTAISLRPGAPPAPAFAFLPLLIAVPAAVTALVLIGRLIYRRRSARREALEMPSEEQARQQMWSAVLEEAGTRTSWFFRLLGIRRVELISRLGPEQCRGRLLASIGGEWTLFSWGKVPHSEYEGAIGHSSFRFTRKRSMFFGNRYPTFLYGRLIADGTGTRIQCRLGPQRLVLALAGVFLFFAGVVFPAEAIRQIGPHPSALLALLFPLLITAFMAAGAAAGRRRVVEDGPELLDFLSQTLEATEAPASRLRSIERAVRR